MKPRSETILPRSAVVFGLSGLVLVWCAGFWMNGALRWIHESDPFGWPGLGVGLLQLHVGVVTVLRAFRQAVQLRDPKPS